MLGLLDQETLADLGRGRGGGMAHSLALSHFQREGLLIRAISLLGVAPGSRGLDVGCGIGLPAMMLARAVGPSGLVLGLDRDRDLLARARELVGRAAVGDRLHLMRGNMNRLSLPKDYFDWLLSIDCAGYVPSPDPVKLLRELARVVKPGGWLAIMAWSGQQLLPGHPGLEERLNATPAGRAPFPADTPPEQYFAKILGWFRDAGLRDSQAHDLSGQVRAPLAGPERQAMRSLLAMRWPGVQNHVSAKDWQDFTRLTATDSSQCLLDRPDYQASFQYTLFQGWVP
jgi:demethylmenaquinone methyltransferase/2-methoxy-6-polyprenyl-1,4-benzoquinol methylase